MAFELYVPSIVEQFLKSKKIWTNMKINDPTWQSFISAVVDRFVGGNHHFFLLDFICSVADGYLAEGRQNEFILDLLQLNVPKLFAVETGADEASEEMDMEVAGKFSLFLCDYINKNALRPIILTQMISILVCLYDLYACSSSNLLLSVLLLAVTDLSVGDLTYLFN